MVRSPFTISTSTDLLNWDIHEKIINGSTDPNPTLFRGIF